MREAALRRPRRRKPDPIADVLPADVLPGDPWRVWLARLLESDEKAEQKAARDEQPTVDVKR